MGVCADLLRILNNNDSISRNISFLSSIIALLLGTLVDEDDSGPARLELIGELAWLKGRVGAGNDASEAMCGPYHNTVVESVGREDGYDGVPAYRATISISRASVINCSQCLDVLTDATNFGETHGEKVCSLLCLFKSHSFSGFIVDEQFCSLLADVGLRVYLLSRPFESCV